MAKIRRIVDKGIEAVCQEVHFKNAFLLFLVLTMTMWAVLYMGCPTELRVIFVFSIFQMIYLYLDDINNLFDVNNDNDI